MLRRTVDSLSRWFYDGPTGLEMIMARMGGSFRRLRREMRGTAGADGDR